MPIQAGQDKSWYVSVILNTAHWHSNRCTYAYAYKSKHGTSVWYGTLAFQPLYICIRIRMYVYIQNVCMKIPAGQDKSWYFTLEFQPLSRFAYSTNSSSSCRWGSCTYAYAYVCTYICGMRSRNAVVTLLRLAGGAHIHIHARNMECTFKKYE